MCFLLTVCRKDENKEKRGRKWPIFKKNTSAQSKLWKLYDRGVSVAQWFHLHIPSCCPGFESQALHLRLLHLWSIYSISVKRLKGGRFFLKKHYALKFRRYYHLHEELYDWLRIYTTLFRSFSFLCAFVPKWDSNPVPHNRAITTRPHTAEALGQMLDWNAASGIGLCLLQYLFTFLRKR